MRLDRRGQSIAGYTLEAQISDGAHAAVYRAQRGPERAAIKVYEMTGAPSALGDLGKRIERERESQRKIVHPCVARLLEWGELSCGSRFLVSEWIDGSTLESRLGKTAMPFSELIPILSAIGRGLHAIHAAGIVHRDLKPSNVILPTTAAPAAVILDFGHALTLDEERLTGSGQVLGTTSYTAPEQAAGKALDGRVDLYALGVIVYRALCGVLPFDDVSAAEVLRKHLSESVIPPRRRAPSLAIPTAAEDLCLWLLAKDPAARLPNSRVLAITLQALEPEDRSLPLVEEHAS